MADVRLPLQAFTRTGTGLKATYKNDLSTSDTYLVANNGRALLHVKNGSGGVVTVTLATPNSIDGLALADRTYAIPAGEERFLGQFPTDTTYNDGVGDLRFTFSAATDVEAAALVMAI